MRSTSLHLALAGALFMAGCDCSLADEAFELAGDGAVDCGFVALGASAAKPFDCALDALEAQRAFVLRLDGFGKDSHVMHAWVGQRDGDVFELLYDGDPGGGGGDGNPRIERFTCVGAHRQRLTANDLASMFPTFGLAEGDDILRCETSAYDGVICD